MNDNKLIAEFDTNPEMGFKLLVQQYQRMVINICYGFLYSREDAEDVAQEVFVEVYEKLPQFRGESKISTWLYRIAANRSLDLIKFRKRKKRFGIMQNLFGADTEEERFASNEQDAGVDMDNAERNRVLHRAISELNKNQQIAITLNRFEDLSYAEIAEIMNTTISAVESLIHRAKSNLKDKLQHWYKKNLE